LAGNRCSQNTPAEIVEVLNKQINAGLADAELKARIDSLGYSAFVNSPAGLSHFIAEDTEKWGKVIRASHIKAG
jgi:tripartite-type tricarboxylate transporter receptor subunit TctC